MCVFVVEFVINVHYEHAQPQCTCWRVSQELRVHHHFSGAWTGRVFPSTGHPDLPTSLRFTLSQLFTCKNTLRSSAPARIWNTSCNTSLPYGFSNVRKLRELLRDSRSVRRRHDARKHTCTDSALGTFAKLLKAVIISIMPVRPSFCPASLLFVRVEEFGSYWTNFHEISYLRIFWKSVEQIQVWPKSYKNNGYFTSRSMYIYDISRNSSHN